MNSPPYLKPAAGIGFSQLLDRAALRLLHGGLLHHVIHPDLFQSCFRVSEHAAGLAENISILLRQGVEQLPEEFDADLAVHGLLRRNGEHPRHQPLVGIAVIALRNKIMHTEEMGVVANISADTSLGDTQLFRDFTGILPCNMIQLLCLPDGSHLVLAQRHTAKILLQPAGHAPLQMRVEVGGEHGAAFVIFFALNPRQKFQCALAAEIVQNRFRIRGKLIRMMWVRRRAVELRRGFLGDAADQTNIFMVQLFQRSIIAVIILANQSLVGHTCSPAFFFGGRPLGLAVLVIPQCW